MVQKPLKIRPPCHILPDYFLTRLSFKHDNYQVSLRGNVRENQRGAPTCWYNRHYLLRQIKGRFKYPSDWTWGVDHSPSIAIAINGNVLSAILNSAWFLYGNYGQFEWELLDVFDRISIKEIAPWGALFGLTLQA